MNTSAATAAVPVKSILIVFAATVLCALQSGCSVIAFGAGSFAAGAMEDAVMRPYDRALRQGQMTPVEYSRQIRDTSRAVDSVFDPNSAAGPRR